MTARAWQPAASKDGCRARAPHDQVRRNPGSVDSAQPSRAARFVPRLPLPKARPLVAIRASTHTESPDPGGSNRHTHESVHPRRVDARETSCQCAISRSVISPGNPRRSAAQLFCTRRAVEPGEPGGRADLGDPLGRCRWMSRRRPTRWPRASQKSSPIWCPPSNLGSAADVAR